MCNSIQKVVVSDDLQVVVHDISCLWLRLIQSSDILINTDAMPVDAPYYTSETKECYKLENVSMGAAHTAEMNGISIIFDEVEIG